jgi:hypothetical protein
VNNFIGHLLLFSVASMPEMAKLAQTLTEAWSAPVSQPTESARLERLQPNNQLVIALLACRTHRTFASQVTATGLEKS